MSHKKPLSKTRQFHTITAKSILKSPNSSKKSKQKNMQILSIYTGKFSPKKVKFHVG